MTDAPTTEKGEVGDLFRTVEMGLDARQFLDSRIGRHIAQRALDEMYAATQTLAEVDPFDHKAIVQAQLTHRVASAALSWLAQAIEAGAQAESTLMAMEQTD